MALEPNGSLSSDRQRFLLFGLFVGIQVVTAGTLTIFSAPLQLLHPSLSTGCDASYQADCVSRGLWMRAAIVNSLMFLVLAILSIMKVFSMRFDRTSILILLATLTAFYYYSLAFISNDVISTMASAIYIGAIIWLLLQTLCIVELAHQLHRYILVVADKQHGETGFKDAIGWYTLHILLSLTMLLSAVYFMGVLMDSVHSSSSCSLMSTVFYCTYWLGIALSLVSMATVANKGLLVPGTIFLYAVALCWYAQLSYPDLQCNASASTNLSLEKISSITVFGVIYLICLHTGIVHRKIPETLRLFGDAYGVCHFCGITWNDSVTPSNSSYHGDVEGGNMRNASSDQTSKDKDGTILESPRRDSPSSSLHNGWMDKDDASSTTTAGETSLLLGFRNGVVESDVWKNHCRNSPMERNDLLLFVAASCYMPMLVTNWGNYDGTPEVTPTITEGNNSTYCMKLLCNGVTWVFFIFALYSSYRVYYEQRNSRSS